jgi:hypothetical protein
MMSNKEKEFIILKMGMNMRENFIIMNFMVAELYNHQMGFKMWEIGLMASSNESEIYLENGITMD